MKLSLSLLLGAFAGTVSAQDATILETATAAGFDTLVAAVSAAGQSWLGFVARLNGDIARIDPIVKEVAYSIEFPTVPRRLAP